MEYSLYLRKQSSSNTYSYGGVLFEKIFEADDVYTDTLALNIIAIVDPIA